MTRGKSTVLTTQNLPQVSHREIHSLEPLCPPVSSRVPPESPGRSLPATVILRVPEGSSLPLQPRSTWRFGQAQHFFDCSA